jgi:hypothetical protein
VLNLPVSVHLADNNHHRTSIHRECLPRYALTIQVAPRNSVYDPRVLRLAEALAQENLSQEGGATINANRALHMEGANGATDWTLGCVEYLMRIDDTPFTVHAHVVERAPFWLLLG